MKNALSALAVSFALLAGAGCVGSSTVVDNIEDSTLVVVNDSDFALVEAYVTFIDSPSWGPNLLGGDVLLPGEELFLDGFPCDFYDAMLVAEDGLSCELYDIELCFDDATWVITNDTCASWFQKPESE
jgi:hypothetical protein